MPGVSVFHKDDDGVLYHRYSTYGRGRPALHDGMGAPPRPLRGRAGCGGLHAAAMLGMTAAVNALLKRYYAA